MCAWDVLKPSGSLVVSAVDDQIRADKVTLLASLNAEHVFTGADTSCGHREGSARISIALVADEGSLDASEGRLYYDPETGLVKYVDSEGDWQVLEPKRVASRCSLIGTGAQTTSVPWVAIPDVIIEAHERASEAHDLHIEAGITLSALVAAKDARLRLTVDDVAVTSATLGQARVGYTMGVTTIHMAWVRLAAELTGTTHEIEVQWQVDAGGGADLTANYNNTIIAFDL